MYYVYVLRSLKNNHRYIGMTADIPRRIQAHNSGLVKSTKNRRPLELIYTEEFETKLEAEYRELFFKTGKGREYLKNTAL
jgi:putative endonuclease